MNLDKGTHTIALASIQDSILNQDIKESRIIHEEFKDLKEKSDIYSRLSKIENKLFEEGGKMNKKGQVQYVLIIVLVVLFLFLLYLAFFK